jgi:tRNA nucleotidyltransferase (CCA-adding enzyme)
MVKTALKALEVLHEQPKPLLQGRDLIALGLKPSKAFKEILDAAYAEQLEGTFSDHASALRWLRLTDFVKNILY